MLTALCLLLAAAWAQAAQVAVRAFPFAEPYFENVGDSSQIPKGFVSALAQDARGFLWIGTQDGVIRYDGYRFRRFGYEPGKPGSLSGSYIETLLPLPDGRLWVGTSNHGLALYDPTSDQFDNFQHDQAQSDSLSASGVRAIASTKAGTWIATDAGLDFLAEGSRRFNHFRHDAANPASLKDNRVQSLLLDRDARLWVGSSGGLQRLQPDGQSFESVAALAGHDIRALFQARDGKLWLGTSAHGAAWLDPATLQLHWLTLPPGPPSHAWIKTIAEDHDGQIWLGSMGGGIRIVASGDGTLRQQLQHDPGLTSSLAFDEVSALLLDRSGLLWVGSRGAGLQRLNTQNRAFRTVRRSADPARGLSHSNVKSVLELDNGQIWLGTIGNGIDILDRYHGLMGGHRAAPNQAGALPDAAVLALAQAKDGTVWAGTQQAGAVRLAPGQSAWSRTSGLPETPVRRMIIARDGTLWVGLGQGLARWDQAGQRFEVMPDMDGKPIRQSILSLAEDAQGRIWAGSNDGLLVWQSGAKGFTLIAPEPVRADGLASGFVRGLLLDQHQRLWLSTDKGLERLLSWDGKQARFEHISTLLGRPGGDTWGTIMEDNQGRIWSTSNVLDPVAMTLQEFSRADGFDVGASWLGGHAKGRDGTLYQGGTLGLQVISPALFEQWQYQPPLVLTELKINGKASALGTLGTLHPGILQLDPEQRNFALEFAALDFSQAHKNQYRYRLQGYDKDWIEVDFEHRNASYGNLWPGSYTLQIRASNRMGQWNAQEINLAIRILPAWYQTWWFGLLMAALLLAGLYAIEQMRTRYLRRRQAVLAREVQQRTRDLQHKQEELLTANQALNQSNDALNHANLELTQSVATLRQLGDMGRDITANLDEERVFSALYRNLNDLLDTQALAIYRVSADGRQLDMIFGREGNQPLPFITVMMDSTTSNSARAARDRQEIMRHFEPDMSDPSHIPGTQCMLTALYTPLIVDDRVLGVMSIQSERPHAYGERERQIFHTLCAYGAIALSNAQALAALHHAQSQLVQQEKLASLGGLVAGIAHEINTPLGNTLIAISGVTEAWKALRDAAAQGRLSRSMLDDNTTIGLEYTDMAERMANKTADLISTFQTIALPTEGDCQSEVDLATFVPEMVNLIRLTMEQNGHRIEISVPPQLTVRIVADALSEALTRILSNVLDHAFAEGQGGMLKVRVQARPQGSLQEIDIIINDNGIGISAQDLPKVFDPFFTTKSGSHGHIGLGLHVAYNHVTQRLKGKISIASTPGQGTTVTICILTAVVPGA
jgi:ligand-binding sensor domain-containing protein/signal transduction histidine kinase